MVILCTIDLETREVSLPAGQVIASYDHNVDVIRFQAETIPGFSLDTSSIRIAAQGPNNVRHDYAVDPSTVQIEEETGYITFDWPIPAGVTEMPIGTFKYGDKGRLIFAVCAEIISGSTVSKAWHSDDGIITVVAHLEPEAGGGEDPEEEATNAQKIAQLQTDVVVINTQVGALANGSPTPVATIAEMTDESAVYLYTGSESGYTAGNWYYYNGSAWTSGGQYGGAVTDTTLSISGAAADAKAVGEALADKADADDVGDLLQLTTTAKEDLVSAINEANGRLGKQQDDFNQIVDNVPNLFTGTFDESGYINPTTGANVNSADYKRTSEYIPVKISNGDNLYFKLSVKAQNMQIVVYNNDKSGVQATASRNNTLDEGIISITEDGYFRLYTNASFSGDVYVGQMPFDDYREYGNFKVSIKALANDVKSRIEKSGLIYQETGINLFDIDSLNVVSNHYLDTSGNDIELADWNISDFINVADLSSVVGSIFNSDGTYATYCKLNFLHTYNSNKVHIGKVWDTSSNGIYTVGSGVAYIRFCWKNNEIADGKKIMVESGSAHSTTYKSYVLYTKLTNSAYPEMDELRTGTFLNDGSISEGKLSVEVQEKLNTIAPSEIDAISCWGDSLTYSQNTAVDTSTHQGDVTYPGKLAQLAGLECANIGMPGANSMDISGLQGGMPIYVRPFTLKADKTLTQVTLIDADSKSSYIGILHWMPRGGWVNPVFNMGLYWEIDGIPVQLVYSGGNMCVMSVDALDSDVVFEHPVKITPVHNYAKKRIQVFWIGTNDAPDTVDKAERLTRIIENVVKYYGGNRYLVVGMTVKSYADASNSILAQQFGNHYVDVKDYMINYGLVDNGLTPTAQDSEDITNGIVPTALRSDSVHFNDYGYTAVANCVYQHGKMLEYWN